MRGNARRPLSRELAARARAQDGLNSVLRPLILVVLVVLVALATFRGGAQRSKSRAVSVTVRFLEPGGRARRR